MADPKHLREISDHLIKLDSESPEGHAIKNAADKIYALQQVVDVTGQLMTKLASEGNHVAISWLEECGKHLSLESEKS